MDPLHRLLAEALIEQAKRTARDYASENLAERCDAEYGERNWSDFLVNVGEEALQAYEIERTRNPPTKSK